MNKQNTPLPKKPMDVIIIGSILALLSSLLCLLGLVTILGIAKMTNSDSRRVFMGLFFIDSPFSHGLRELIYGLCGFIASLGLIKLKNWARYILIFFLLICVVDVFLVFSRFSLITNMGFILTEVFLVCWLFYRRTEFQKRKL